MPVFASLLDLLFPPRVDERVVRGVSEELLAGLVKPVLVPGTKPVVTGLLPFGNERVRALVHEAKYHGRRRAFGLLGEVLGEYLLDLGSEESFGKAVLVPIPLSRERLRSRGYNQAEAIALRAAKHAGIEVRADILARTRDTAPQTTLTGAGRRENLRGAFAATNPIDPSYTYILLDDVVTTGATLGSAADALLDAGAKRVLPVALAH
ncbi:MAG: hypothetical protein WDN10_04335 [bacterium]